ncbi:aminotransferase-like domain-containing protein [Clostridium sp. DL1XJH146]
MIFNIKLDTKKKIYTQIYEHLKKMIITGMLPCGSKLPSTRELSSIINISRNSVIYAYNMLAEDNLIHSIKNKGYFVSNIELEDSVAWDFNWNDSINDYSVLAEQLDIMKTETIYKKGMISFKSIAPDGSFFDIEEVKRSFLNVISKEGEKILNYGYAQGYKNLIDYLMQYMHKKGVNIFNKKILITNGFTEAFDILLSSLTVEGDTILCENPTHNTAIKLMKLHKLNILGIPMTSNGIDLSSLEKNLKENKVKIAFLVPSYHNPTGLVMSYKKRKDVYDMFRKFNIPIIEDGFNEELQFSSDHIAPMTAIGINDNSIIYIGSLSKILFPGLRIGWIFADPKLINLLESVKRSRNIHTSFLDQAILYDYLNSGNFDKYVKRIRNVYREKFIYTKRLATELIPHKFIWGDGGLFIFIKLDNINSRDLLKKCTQRNVIFTPGDIFYCSDAPDDTLRLSYSRLSLKEIEIGIKIIGEEDTKLRVTD